MTVPNTTQPAPESLIPQLPPRLYYQFIHSLTRALPAPLSDSPEDLARRNEAAVAWVAALHPANIAEAELAVLHVTAAEQSKRCIQIAEGPETSLEWAVKCRAQSNSMMRQSQGALRLLLRVQSARQKLEADTEAHARTAAAEQHAITHMTEALKLPPPAPRPKPPPQEKPAPTPDHVTRREVSFFRKDDGRLDLVERLTYGPEDLVQQLVAAGLPLIERHYQPFVRKDLPSNERGHAADPPPPTATTSQ